MRNSTPLSVSTFPAVALLLLGGAMVSAEAQEPEISRAERAIFDRLTWETDDSSLCQFVSRAYGELDRLREQVEQARLPARDSTSPRRTSTESPDLLEKRLGRVSDHVFSSTAWRQPMLMFHEGCLGLAASLIGKHGRTELIPALRAVLRQHVPSLAAVDEWQSHGSYPAHALIAALRDLGDVDFLDELYGAEVEGLIASLADSTEVGAWSPAAYDRLVRIHRAGLGQRLIERRPVNGWVLSTPTPLQPVHYGPPLQLTAAEELRVLLRGVKHYTGIDGLLVAARGHIGVTPACSVLVAPAPEVEAIAARRDAEWRRQDWSGLLRTLQELRQVSGSELADFAGPVPLPLARFLVELVPYLSSGSGESSSSRRVSEIRSADLGPARLPELVVGFQEGGWESLGGSVSIFSFPDDAGQARRIWKKSLSYANEIEDFRVTWHAADVDDDPDRELLLFEGTLEGSDLQRRAATWKVRIYDLEGGSYRERAIHQGVREHLRRYYRETGDSLERTVIRSHFGGPPE